MLDYQPFASKILLEVLLNLDQALIDSQNIDQFSKIKLSIIIRSDDETNSKLATDLLARFGGELDYDLIMSLDFSRFAKEIPFDLHELTATILNDSVSHLDDINKTSFFNKILGAFQDEIEKSKKILNGETEEELENNKFEEAHADLEDIEEGLDVYNVILEGVISSCPSDSLYTLFTKFMGKYDLNLIFLTHFRI